MRKLATLMLFVVAIAPAAAPAPATQPGYDNSEPKYADPTYETIWSQKPPWERSTLLAGSAEAAERGWTYLRRGDIDVAIRRFNQAWSLHPQNPKALWGMAIVQFERAKRVEPDVPGPAEGAPPPDPRLVLLTQAANLVDEALATATPTPDLLTDAALVHATLGGFRRYAGQNDFQASFDRAEALLTQADALADHPMIHETWAALEQYRGRTAEAGQHLAQAAAMRREMEAAQRTPPHN